MSWIKPNNSEDLNKIYKLSTSHGLDIHDPKWVKFAQAFDCPKAAKVRVSAHNTRYGTDPLYAKICDLEFERNEDSFFMRFKEGRGEDFTFEDLQKCRNIAAHKMAAILYELIKSDSDRELERLIEAKKTWRDARSFREKECPICEAVNALNRFLQRERRLPKKAELNLEAYRQHFKVSLIVETPHFEPPDHGALFDFKGESYRALRSFPDRTIDGVRTVLVSCIPANQWSEKRWTTYPTKVLKSSGLGGLPQQGGPGPRG